MNVTFPGAAREIAGSCYPDATGTTRFTAACLACTGSRTGLRLPCNFAPGKTDRLARLPITRMSRLYLTNGENHA